MFSGSSDTPAENYYRDINRKNREFNRNVRDEQRRREIQGFPENNYRDTRQVQSEVGNPHRLEIYLNVDGDYKKKLLKYYPWMSDINLKPQSQYPYIFYNSVLRLNKALLRKANIGEDPKEIFSNLTNYRKLLQYANRNLITEMRKNPTEIVGPGDISYARSILKKNMDFLKNIYFKPKQFFYDNNNRKYVIRKSNISYMEPKNEDRQDTWEIHFDIAVIDAEKNPGMLDLMRGNCNDKAKEIDDIAYQLFGDTFGFYIENLIPERKLGCAYGNENCVVDKRTSDSDRYGSDRYGSDRYGSDRYGSDRYGSDRYDRYGSDRYGSDRYGRYGSDRYDRYGSDRYGSDRYRSDRYDSDRYGSDRYRSDRYDSDRYDSDRYRSDRYDSDRYYSDRYGRDRRELDPNWRDIDRDIMQRRRIPGGKKTRKSNNKKKYRKRTKSKKK